LPDVKISPASIVIALALILILGVFSWLTFGPKPPPPPPPVLTAEGKQYLNNLVLSNVRMQAAGSLVNQRVVEILGTSPTRVTRRSSWLKSRACPPITTTKN
jgi:hypothetical protein